MRLATTIKLLYFLPNKNKNKIYIYMYIIFEQASNGIRSVNDKSSHNSNQDGIREV